MGEDYFGPAPGIDPGDALSGLTGGAMGGLALGGSIGAIGGPIGAGIGGLVGLIGGLFGKSEAQVRRERAIQALQQLRLNRQHTLSSTAKIMGEQALGLSAAATGSAKARALKEGRTDASGDIAAAQQGVAAQTTPALWGALNNINQTYDTMQSKLGMDYASSPIPPSLGSSALTLGSSLLKMRQAADYIDILRGMTTPGTTPAVTPKTDITPGISIPEFNSGMGEYMWGPP